MALSVDTSTVAIGSFVTSVAWSHTVTGSDTGGIVGTVNNGSALAPSSATWNGVSMTLENSRADGAGTDRVTQWSLINPTTGTLSVTWSSAQNIVVGATSFRGANQTSLVSNKATTAAFASSLSLSVTSQAGELVLDVTSWTNIVNNSASVGAQQTQQWQSFVTGTYANGASSTESGSATVQMSWAYGSLYWAALAAVSIAAASGAAAVVPRYRMLLGAGF